MGGEFGQFDEVERPEDLDWIYMILKCNRYMLIT